MARNWWKLIFSRRDATTTIDPDDVMDPPPPPTGQGPALDPGPGGPAIGVFSFLTAAAEPGRTPAAEPVVTSDTVPNPVLTTGRLRALGLTPVLVPSLREQVLLHRLVAQEQEETHPGEALGRWMAVTALCPNDLEARLGTAAAHERLRNLADAETAYRAALALSSEDAQALAGLARVGSQPAPAGAAQE